MHEDKRRENVKPEKLVKIKKLSDAIEEFNGCYADCVLWGSCPDGDVHRETILSWLIENPHMSDIAKRIKELDR